MGAWGDVKSEATGTAAATLFPAGGSSGGRGDGGLGGALMVALSLFPAAGDDWDGLHMLEGATTTSSTVTPAC